ncbi:hypothetical protein INS49_015486 [Diaporthe citri]|uniref:uncharacterized protein n=1 Tax=Diaporthe citri TaxID=83186 RepID=UPI001C7F573E|nr:uncharacterized protein INS49_015486 [Diaporthe citri]KAG6356101.1 hypothetical protein INS49_015486 [Diaporthe citri]
MANQIKQYFLAPSWDYPPKGSIVLGNIIVSPTRPVPPLIAVASAAGSQGLISSTKHGVEWQKGKTSAHKFGIWTKFIDFLGINVGIDVSSGSDDTFRFEKMRTEEFFPDGEYINTLLKRSPVATRMLTKQHKDLFVIVGVKTVSGAAVKRAHSGNAGGSLDISIDATVAGSPVPASIGPSVVSSSEDNESVSFEGSDDFVFAFRVQKLRVKRREENVRQEDYAKGALFEYGAGRRKEPEALEISELNSSDGLDGFLSQGVDDEGDQAVVYVPKTMPQA